MNIKNRFLVSPSVLGCCIFVLAVPAYAGVFKCVAPDGKIAYQQGPCAAAASSKIIEGTMNVAAVANRAEIRKNLSKAKRKSKDKPPTQRAPGKNESAYARRMRLQNAMVKGDVIKGMDRRQVTRALRKMKKTGNSGRKNHDSETYRGKDGARAKVRYDKYGFVEEYSITRNKQ